MTTAPKVKNCHLLRDEANLNNGELGGGNVKSVNVRSQTGEGLLGAIGSRETNQYKMSG